MLHTYNLLLLKEQLSPWQKGKSNKCPPFDKSFPQKAESSDYIYIYIPTDPVWVVGKISFF